DAAHPLADVVLAVGVGVVVDDAGGERVVVVGGAGGIDRVVGAVGPRPGGDADADLVLPLEQAAHGEQLNAVGQVRDALVDDQGLQGAGRRVKARRDALPPGVPVEAGRGHAGVRPLAGGRDVVEVVPVVHVLRVRLGGRVQKRVKGQR